VRLPRTKDDEQPFAGGGTGVVDVGRLVGGQLVGDLVDGDVRNRFRIRIEHWARRRGLPVADSRIVVEAEGVTARVPLYEITEATAVVRGTAAQPVKMSIAIEPASWTQRLRSRLGGGSFETGDHGFDRRWRVIASDVGAARQVFDEEGREALRDVGCWCRATYTDGEIEVRLDDDRLAGTHVLGGDRDRAAPGAHADPYDGVSLTTNTRATRTSGEPNLSP